MSRPSKGTTTPGFINPNNQKNHGQTDPPKPGNDHGQWTHVMECLHCHYRYGANGTDIHNRRCPKCQAGQPGLPI